MPIFPNEQRLYKMLFFAIVIALLLLHFRKILGNLHFHIGNGIIIYQIPVFPIGCQRSRSSHQYQKKIIFAISTFSYASFKQPQQAGDPKARLTVGRELP